MTIALSIYAAIGSTLFAIALGRNGRNATLEDVWALFGMCIAWPVTIALEFRSWLSYRAWRRKQSEDGSE